MKDEIGIIYVETVDNLADQLSGMKEWYTFKGRPPNEERYVVCSRGGR